MIKNILLPTDFSDNAWSAANYAIKLFAEETCNFYFLHSSHLRSAGSMVASDKLERVVAEQNMQELTELKTQAEAAFANSKHNFNIILSKNDLNEAIEGAIAQYQIDLVVMGTKGASKSKEIFFGSNTVDVIKKINASALLMVPDAFDYVKPKQIAFPTDFNRSYGKEIEYVKQLSALYGSKIRVVHISKEKELSDQQNKQRESLELALKNQPHSFHWMSDNGKKENAIKDFIEELNIDILAMIHYKHSFLEYVFKEPIIKRIGFQPTIPFLVIPNA